jgi:8-oxo-dGTP diphosphatase
MSCFDAPAPGVPPAKIIYVAAVVLVDSDGRVLLAQRPEGKNLAGFWEFPGGKIEAGETPEAALTRELQEELGIDTKASCLAPLTFVSHRYDEFHLLMAVFVCRVWQGVVTSKEHQALAWVYPKDFNQYKMPPADLPILPVLYDLL